jgi:hypothetical protein
VPVGIGLNIEPFPGCEVDCLGLDDGVECANVNVELTLHAMEVLEELERLVICAVFDEDFLGVDGLDDE